MHILSEGLKYTRAAQIQSNTYSCGSNNSAFIVSMSKMKCWAKQQGCFQKSQKMTWLTMFLASYFILKSNGKYFRI